jgi:phospholipid/cholesterol/gamma-HCH transport system ATP-binding protein
MGFARVEGLVKSFGERHVLAGVNLTLNEGEILCVVGKSGTGKSVLLKHLFGFLEPDEGMIFVDDERADHVPPDTRSRIRKKFGILFQGAALFDSMNIYDNIAFGPRRTGMQEKDVRDCVIPLAERLALGTVLQKFPSELSGGLQKRVGLCRSLAMQPEIMLYDEPTTGVDPITGASVDRMILEMREYFNITSLVITHDMNAVRRVADRVAMLHEGKVIFEGTRDGFFTTPDPVIRQFIEGRSHA